MGLFTSKPVGDEMYAPATPNREVADHTGNKGMVRILPLDPRSPTPEVVRTPIQVESTPNNKLKFTWQKEAQIDKVFKRNFLFRDEQVPTENKASGTNENEAVTMVTN